MPLASGTRLGSYEVLGALGAGGMGEVYRASDTKLKREVAIKVLPEAFARDEERMKRFEREAQVLASLNHPNVAAIYGLEDADGVRALVLELVEGPTLAERIAASPIPAEEALRIAAQIAHGLEAAHDKGIIHRDLKPANVKLTNEGDVKLLDFGLAKALDVDPPVVEVSHSPTLTRAGTQAGVLLGTASYMSPEQARGKPADRRADVWSFGVVLYEMLTGTRAFAGEDVSETLAHVLTKEPEWSRLPAAIPARIRWLLARCLTKDPRKRLQAIGEARIAVEGAYEAGPEIATGARPTPILRPSLTGALGLALGLVAAFWALRPRTPASPSTPLRLSAELGAAASLVSDFHMEGQGAVLSPDGALLAFVAQPAPGALQQLYVRRLEALEASLLPGTQGARNPLFSPDGSWIAFFAEDRLKKIAVGGGGGVTLCDAPGGYGGSWGADARIVFSTGGGAGLSRVSAGGGSPEALTRPDTGAGEGSHRWPQMLPGGKAVLYTASTPSGSFDDASVVAQSLPDGPRKVLHRGGYHGRYLPSGHLVYVREGTLFAAAFDLDRLELTGPPAPAVEGVWTSTLNGGAQFASSDRGDLVYVPRDDAESLIVWAESAGKLVPLRDTPGDYASPRFSPDGGRLALDIGDRNQRDIWVYELGRASLSRLTFDPARDTLPAWSPDGLRIAFSSERAEKGTRNLYWQRADGTGDAERLTVSGNSQWLGSWHPSGKLLAFAEMDREIGSPDIMILPMEGSEASGWKPGKPSLFLKTPFVDNLPEFSPDGRWLAYMSNETGRFEVYVRPFPGPGGKWQLSAGGGHFPMWSRTRRELFYWAGDSRIMVVRYAVEGDSFRAETAFPWSERPFARRPQSIPIALHPDGKRFAVVTSTAASSETKRNKVFFIVNFFDYLRRIAPAGTR